MILNGFPGGPPGTPLGEVDLNQYMRDVRVIDANGCIKEVQFKRLNLTPFMKRVYTNPDSTTGLYKTCAEYFYADNGTTVLETHTYTFSFLDSGNIASSIRVVT